MRWPASRYHATGLAFAYPVTAHIAIARHSTALTIAAIGLGAAALLLPALLRGRLLAWLAVPLIALACWWLAANRIAALPLYAPPVLINLFMAWVFGHTLAAGRMPLISRLVRLLHPPEDEIDPAVWPYARRLTLAWTMLFLALAALNLALAALAEPDGLMIAAGYVPLVTVPRELWSAFANLGNFLIVAAFFILEYAYRRRRFPRQPYRNMLDFMRRAAAVGPKLFGRDP